MGPSRISILCLCAALDAAACVNTSFSSGPTGEDHQITSDLVKVIMGEFPEHSDAFWDHELRRTAARIEDAPGDFEAWNDRAVALLKLRRHQEAETEFLRNEERWPRRYKTAANLGVLYKKMGRYSEAADATRRALEIKPAGHLGLGDYYLRMLEWRDRVAREPSWRKRTNFLGIPRGASPEEVAADPLVNRGHLLSLIKADRHFADAYAVLGDVLYAEGDYANSARAYARARALDDVSAYAKRAKLRPPGRHMFQDHSFTRDFEGETAQVAKWQSAYGATEGELLRGRPPGDLPPLAAETLAAMAGKQIPTPVYMEYVRRHHPRLRFWVGPVILVLGLLCVPLYYWKTS